MSELRQAVAVITEYTGSNNMDVPDHLGPAADLYARACRSANERLTECDRLLRTGMRSEALRQVQLEPDVLDLYKELALRDWDRWAEIAQRVGLTVPPRLNADAARRLNEGFALEQKVGELLRQHRSLALSRAALRRRLEIVRLLHRAEPLNLGWQDDIGAYEAARFEEMRRAIADPARRGNWEEVRALFEEISSDAWVSPPPLDLVAPIQEAHATLRSREGRRLLAGISPRLLAAMNDGDVGAAGQLEEEARGVAAKFGIPDDDQALDVACEAAAWAKAERKRRKKERDFQKMVGVLKDYLTDGTDWWYVQEQYRLVRDFDLPIPADVLRLYAARARARKLMWVWGAAGAAVVAALGVTVYLVKF